MEDPTKIIVSYVRIIMARLAKIVNRLAKGRIKPAHVTTVSLIGHFPAAWALYYDRPILAGVLIVIFGMLDSFDGALAREQGTVSKLGMFYDATTDRMKEILVFSGLAVFVGVNYPEVSPWLVVSAMGTSILVSYVKAKGEMAISNEKHNKQDLNRVFDGGIARYEIRMLLVVVGLLAGYIVPVLRLIVALNLFTAATRFIEISHLLSDENPKKKTK